MRNIDTIIVHCSATKAGKDFTAADIDRWHQERGFNGIGYHYVIRLDGRIEKGRDVAMVGAHCKGWNGRSIGICYIGGLDAAGHPADTRTGAQKRVLYELIQELQREYEIGNVMGHRDAPSIKACPCFDVRKFMQNGRELLFIWWVALLIPVLLTGCRAGKETMNSSSEMAKDSCFSMAYGKSAVEFLHLTDTDSQTVVEHIEQTVTFVPVDTTQGGVVTVVKSVVDRKKERNRLLTAESAVARKDSLCVDAEVMVRDKEVVKKVVSSRHGNGIWWKIGVYVLIGIMMLYGGWVLGRRR